MNINERIKHVRKNLGLNQAGFGERIGLKQGAISKLEQDGSTVTDQNVHMICDVFGISEQWLRTGEGEMRADSRDTYIKKLAQQYQLGAAHAGMIEAFLRLTSEQRDSLLAIMRQMVEGADDADRVAESRPNTQDYDEHAENQPSRAADPHLTVEEKRAIINRELDAEAAAPGKWSASTSANGGAR